MIQIKPIKSKWNVRLILAPVLVVCHVFGVTLNYKKAGKVFGLVHRILVLALCIVIFIHEIPSMEYWQAHSEGVHAVIVLLDTISRWTTFFFNFIVTACKNGKINAIIGDLQNVTVPPPQKVQSTIFKFHLGYILFNIISLWAYNILAHDVTWQNSNYKPYSSTLYTFSDLLILLCCFEFIQMINLIKEIFKEINSKLKDSKRQFASEGRGRTCLRGHTVVQLRRVHLFLCKTCEEVNNCFTYQLLLVILFSMIQVIYASRAVVGDFGITDVEVSVLNVFTDFVWVMPFAFILIQLIAFCEKTAFECRRTIVVVHHLMNIYYYDSDLVKELEIFAMQIQQHPITFNVRFFELDYPLLNTLVSSMVTYLIIMVTFQGESDSGTIRDWNFKQDLTTGLPRLNATV